MSSTVNSLNDSTVSTATSGTTSNGTQIVTRSSVGGSMDKTAFLKILAAEMSNLDPTSNQDSTAYVTQMAQFASIEQMQNLNTTITKSSYEQLVGKGVVMSDEDTSGNAIAGSVEGVTTDSNGKTYVQVLYEDDGESYTNWFSASDVQTVTDSNTANASTKTALNTDFLAASELKSQDVVVSTTDTNDADGDGDKTDTIKVSGTVKSVYIDSGVVMLRVTTKAGTTEEYPYTSIVQAGDLESSTTTA